MLDILISSGVVGFVFRVGVVCIVLASPFFFVAWVFFRAGKK